MTEEHVLEPTNPYAATKAAAEFLVKAYSRSFGLRMIITRSNNAYGPHQYPEKLIPKLIHQLIRGRKLTIHGTGENLRNYLYIQDIVSAFDLILHEGVIGQIYNIGSDTELSNKQVATDLIQLFDGQVENNRFEFVQDRAFNDQRYTINSTKLNRLGWTPEVTWKDGLKRTMDWFLANIEQFDNLETALLPHPPARTSPSMHFVVEEKYHRKRPCPEALTVLDSIQGHKLRLYRTKPKVKSRETEEYDSDGVLIPYGSSGVPTQYHRCFVCYKKGKRSNTRFYCNRCMRPVCAQKLIQTTADGERYVCWNELHRDTTLFQRKRNKSSSSTCAVNV